MVEHGPVPNPQQPLSHPEPDKLWERGKPKKEFVNSTLSASTTLYKEADVNSVVHGETKEGWSTPSGTLPSSTGGGTGRLQKPEVQGKDANSTLAKSETT